MCWSSSVNGRLFIGMPARGNQEWREAYPTHCDNRISNDGRIAELGWKLGMLMREWSYFTWSQFPLYKCIIVLLLLNRTWGIINNLYPIIIMMRESWTILVKKVPKHKEIKISYLIVSLLSFNKISDKCEIKLLKLKLLVVSTLVPRGRSVVNGENLI